jgi:DNA-binding response OmpR family regulator
MTVVPEPCRTTTVLVADEDDACRRGVKALFAGGGFDVLEARSGEEALEAATTQAVDVLVLDLVLPALSGNVVLRELRRTSDLPVIFLSGVTDVKQKVRVLDLGADDYLTKPFIPGELLARVRAVLRRRSVKIAEHLVTHDLLQIDLTAREATLDGQILELTYREFDLLAFFAGAPRQVFSRDELLRRVWGSCEQWQTPATVTEHVRRVRLKIEPDPQHPTWITTVRSAGYRFDPVGSRS